MLREDRARGNGERAGGRRDAAIVVVLGEGVGFNMSQLAPRTRIIVDTYVPFRWEPGLRPTFRCRRSGRAGKRGGGKATISRT